MTTDYSKCQAKGGAANCRHHKKLFGLQQEIADMKRQFLVSPAEGDLDRYHDIKRAEQQLLTYISVNEHNDFGAAVDALDTELEREVKELIYKRAPRLSAEDLNWADYVQAAVSFTTAQSYGTRIEGLYIKKMGYEKVHASTERGDAKDPATGRHIEIKFTVVGAPSYQVDLVQIRPHHNLDDYHVLVFDKETGATEFYALTKEQMSAELATTGYRLAHGTEKGKDKLTSPEYAVRFKRDSEAHQRWQQYRKPVTWQ